MSNHGESAKLIVSTIDKGAVDETSLIEILETDSDFLENEEYFRPDTLKKGFKNEAERVSKEIFTKFKKIKDEETRVDKMVKALFDVSGFIGHSQSYGDYTYQITETEFQYVVSIAYVM